MLRGAVLAVGILMLLAGVATAGLGVPGLPLWLLIAGGVITAGTLLERAIYKPLLREKPGAGWVKTAERFIDPELGQGGGRVLQSNVRRAAVRRPGAGEEELGRDQ